MLNRCVKLFLVLLLVAAVAVGVSFLPFSLSDKFKKVAEKVTSHLRGLTNFGQGDDVKLHLDLSKRDSYTLGDLNVVLDKMDNVPKEGFLKFVHKGEKDVPLNVEKFMNGETELEGLEPGLFDYCAGYFKKDHTHLLAVELMLHDNGETPKTDENKPNGGGEGGQTQTPAGGNGNTGGEGNTPKKNGKMFFVPGENNKWVKLAEGVDLGLKLEQLFTALTANTNNNGAPTPAGGNTSPNGGTNHPNPLELSDGQLNNGGNGNVGGETPMPNPNGNNQGGMNGNGGQQPGPLNTGNATPNNQTPGNPQPGNGDANPVNTGNLNPTGDGTGNTNLAGGQGPTLPLPAGGVQNNVKPDGDGATGQPDTTPKETNPPQEAAKPVGEVSTSGLADTVNTGTHNTGNNNGNNQGGAGNTQDPANAAVGGSGSSSVGAAGSSGATAPSGTEGAQNQNGGNQGQREDVLPDRNVLPPADDGDQRVRRPGNK